MNRIHHSDDDIPIDKKLHSLWHTCAQLDDITMVYKCVADYALWRGGLLDDAGMPEFQFNTFVDALVEAMDIIDTIAVDHDDDE